MSHSSASGSTQYAVPSNSTTGDDFKIQVILYRGESESAQDWSDAPFMIAADTTGGGGGGGGVGSTSWSQAASMLQSLQATLDQLSRGLR
ncbi:MAG: hypothetical protein HY978_03615 [Candidatus Liptonbacteria bacterium]|nr:hypothetical protein [Candidatus Liptonbacteria bacterium]